MHESSPHLAAMPETQPQSIHVMIDLETWGVSNDAAIISIGAVKFTLSNPYVIVDKLHVVVDPGSNARYGLKMDATTLMWWMHKARDEARQRLLTAEQVDIASALDGFRMWFGDESLPTWGNGASFDNVILRNAYRLTGLGCPWKFHDDRCYRTMKNLDPHLKLERAGTHHDALDDAVHQALHLQKISKNLDICL